MKSLKYKLKGFSIAAKQQNTEKQKNLKTDTQLFLGTLPFACLLLLES